MQNVTPFMPPNRPFVGKMCSWTCGNRNNSVCTTHNRTDTGAHMKIEIRNRWNASVIFSHDVADNSVALTVALAYESAANLNDADLSGAELSGVDLSGAELIGADLSNANLRGANLSRANLINADLSDADLSNANLIEADLIDANLRGADLSGVEGLLPRDYF